MKLIISRLRDAKCTGQLLGATQKLYYLFDELGSVTAITDDSGMPIKYYLYDPYGNVTNTTNDPVNNLTFIGRYGGFKDWSTGFINFWHRWYDSEVGKWTTKDPIGVRGGNNLYQYTSNNPVNGVDVSGLGSKEKSDSVGSKCKIEYDECMKNAENVFYITTGTVLGAVALCIVTCELICKKVPACSKPCQIGCIEKATLVSEAIAAAYVQRQFECKADYETCKGR